MPTQLIDPRWFIDAGYSARIKPDRLIRLCGRRIHSESRIISS
jgi:hypothetical protein